ncbi:MAG: GAF domain-containing protein [bacterium]|nr:GAF domain-containing protein [bacterium]
MDNKHDGPSMEQLKALYRIGNALCSTLQTDEVLDRILSETISLFDAEAGSIMLLNDKVLRIRRAKGLSDEIIQAAAVPLGQGIAGHVAKTGEALLINGKVNSSLYPGAVERQEEISSSLCAPITSRSELLGVLMIRSSKHSFSSEQLEYLKSLADQAAIALENSRLFDNIQQQAFELKEEQNKLKAIFGAMADGLVIISNQGVVKRINRRAKEMLRQPDSFEGKLFTEAFPSFPLSHIIEHLSAHSGNYELDLTVKGEIPSVLRTSVTFWGNSEEGLVLLLHDVTERVKVERMKTEFVSAVSHELKTPLTTISGFLELLAEREFPRERQLKYLEICSDEAARLQSLIDELLTLSKLEAGKLTIASEAVSLNTLTSRILANFAERYPHYEFKYSSNIEEVNLEADNILITQVIINLLSNAVKYGKGHGRIELHIEAEDKQVSVSVSDEGIGIPQDKLQFIFDKFYRVDNSLTRSTCGTGLGLANARYIVEGHGGSIWAESSEGCGSKFTFTLPRRQDHCEAAG